MKTIIGKVLGLLSVIAVVSYFSYNLGFNANGKPELPDGNYQKVETKKTDSKPIERPNLWNKDNYGLANDLDKVEPSVNKKIKKQPIEQPKEYTSSKKEYRPLILPTNSYVETVKKYQPKTIKTKSTKTSKVTTSKVNLTKSTKTYTSTSSGYYSTNTNPNHQYVSGYTKKNGTKVEGYYRTKGNSTTKDNFSYKGNLNPYTGKIGKKK